ncbi:ATP-grasp domain-containing protein [Paenibacillus sp. PAMC21692]|uniref:ATP-grasp domain-containing protein n=1 Tax=Paenibacillus sp. PAMC21692 TaxID=2762320 RepID=UPI00164D14C0|nr:ATP-grasp domain-containing protein [Paenibacillus sp. PAMC21692]QNK58377.1 ATP-grasp domain-containing protein [Paenibacillus sp. PAMC21692]
MNVLITSVSNKIPMINAVKAAMNRTEGYKKLFGADINKECIGQYFVDHFWPCPPLQGLSIYALTNFCRLNKIKIIYPTRDGELLYYAVHRRFLSEQGIEVMVSDKDAIELCLDKLLFYSQLSAFGYPVIPTYNSLIQGIEFYVVKERYGAGSHSIGIGLDQHAALNHALKLQQPIFQPYIKGIEYSVDVYLSNEAAIAAIVRERRLVVRGESQITCTVNNPVLETLCMEIAVRFNLKGHILFQIIVDEYGGHHIVECNARFGGASTLSLAVGLDSFYWFMQESVGAKHEELIYVRAPEEKMMIRHAEDWIYEDHRI